MASKPAATVVVEPRYSKAMPWVLIAAAILVGAVALALRADLHRDSVIVVEDRRPTLVEAKRTTTEKPLSDGALSTMLGIAALLCALGAFYSRISKFTIAGQSVELAGGAVAAAEDDKAIAEEVKKRVAEQLRSESDEKQALPADRAAEIAEKGAAAAAQMQLEAARLRLAATSVTAAAPQPPTISVDPDELKALSSGMPLPSSLLSRLADEALSEAEGD